MTDFL
jgi:hypothetical protein